MRGYPSEAPRPSWTPLAVTLGLHLLIALAWLARPAPPPGDAGGEVMSVLVRVPAPAPEPAKLPKPGPRPLLPSSVRHRDEPLLVPTAPALPIPSAPSDPVAPAISVPSSPPTASDLLARARQQAGAIDHELRDGRPAAPLSASGAQGRLERGIAGAYIDRSRTVRTDSYTSPDGVVTYRMRVGDKVLCRKSGSVAPGLEYSEGARLAGAGSAGSATTAGFVPCPTSDVDWKRR
jgi:hypothetical protein